jgi:hypothetical protein
MTLWRWRLPAHLDSTPRLFSKRPLPTRVSLDLSQSLALTRSTNPLSIHTVHINHCRISANFLQFWVVSPYAFEHARDTPHLSPLPYWISTTSAPNLFLLSTSSPLESSALISPFVTLVSRDRNHADTFSTSLLSHHRDLDSSLTHRRYDVSQIRERAGANHGASHSGWSR